MVDLGNNAGMNDRADSHQQPVASDTTSIALPPVSSSFGAAPALAPDELAAVRALPAGSALLIAQAGPNSGARFLLDSELTSVGRHPDADIFLDDVTVSRRHVQFTKVDGGFELVDQGSLNGTYVNGDRVDALTLQTGAEVQIGKFRFTYYFSTADSANS